MLIAYRAEADADGNLIRFHLAELTVDCNDTVRRVFRDVQQKEYKTIKNEMDEYVHLVKLGEYNKEDIIELILKEGKEIQPLVVSNGNVVVYVTDKAAYCGEKDEDYTLWVRFAGKKCCVDNQGNLGDNITGWNKMFDLPNINTYDENYIIDDNEHNTLTNRVLLIYQNSLEVVNGWVTLKNPGGTVIIPKGFRGLKGLEKRSVSDNPAGRSERNTYEEIRLGSGVQLESMAFWGLDIKKLVIDEGIQYLDSGVFYDLSTPVLELPDSIKSLGIIEGAEVKKLRLPKDIEVLPDRMFRYSTINECELPDKIKVIGHKAFAGCSWGSSMKIPSKTTIIGGAAFEIKGEIRKDIVLPGSVRIVGKAAVYPNLRPIVGGNPHIVLENGELLWTVHSDKKLWKLEILNNVETFLRINTQAELLSDGTVII